MTNKIIIFFLINFVFYNCTSGQKNDCSRNTNFGIAQICLPKITGYKECYLNPSVKELADITETPTNTVLGYYLNEEVYDKKTGFKVTEFDDYFKIYAAKQMQNYKADEEAIKEFQSIMNSSFLSKNWEEVEKRVDKIGLDLKIGTPVLIKTYKLNEKSFSSVMLTKYEGKNVEPYTMVVTINGLLLNERLVFMAYYLYYEGEETVSKIEEKSNFVIKKLIKANE